MKTKFLLSFLLIASSLTGFCTVWTITNSGTTFSPSTITINLGDTVNFTLASQHNVIEVSQSTWNSNGNTPLNGGFQLPFGGGTVLPAKLTTGTHYYVCQPHAQFGMKGTIIVLNPSGMNENQETASVSIFPNPASNFITIKSNKRSTALDFTITDVTGKQVLNGQLTNESTLLNTSQLANGVYWFMAGDLKQSFNIIKN